MFMQFIRLLAVTLSAMLLSGCAAAVIGGAAAGGYYASQSNRAGANAADARITSTINSLYVKDAGINALDIHVATYRGTVTLQGNVASRSVQQHAVALARSVEGVNNVVNRLTVVSR